MASRSRKPLQFVSKALGRIFSFSDLRGGVQTTVRRPRSGPYLFNPDGNQPDRARAATGQRRAQGESSAIKYLIANIYVILQSRDAQLINILRSPINPLRKRDQLID